MHKKIFFYIVISFVLFGCNKKNDIGIIEDIPLKTLIEKINVRQNTEIVSVVENILNGSNFSNKNKRAASTKQMSNSLEIKALTTELLNYKTNHIDTLLFLVKDKNSNKNILISANIDCEPILAILDESNDSFEKSLNINDQENPLTPFLLNAVKYNQNPTYFDNTENSLKNELSLNKRAAVGDKGRNGKIIAFELLPRVKVQWGQSQDPYSRYTPNNWPAGCVATTIAQAMTVTRHIGEFNGVRLDWDKLVRMKNSGYVNQYPEEANTIGLLLREIGSAVNMKYGAQGSSASTKDGVKILEIGKQFYSLGSKGSIKLVLDESPNNLIIISSRNKKSSWIGVPRGSGHAYIVDGYQVFADGTDLMHVNFGWNGYQNGYYLTKLWAPYFTGDAPAKFPHKWEFFCIRKR